MMEALLRDLRQPEYVHVLLNPLPIYGLGLGLVGLTIALCLQSRAAQVTVLLLILISTVSAWPVIYFGNQAESQILMLADEDGRAWLKVHEQRVDLLIYAFLALGAVTLAALVLPRKWPATAVPFAIATGVLVIGSLGAGAWVGDAGGKIRHREFRTTPLPETQSTGRPLL